MNSAHPIEDKAGAPGTGAAIIAQTTRASVRSRSTASEAQRERILAMLRTGEKSTLDFRRAGVMQSGTRILELREHGHCILTVARRTLYDADGYAHRGVAIYALAGETGGSGSDRTSTKAGRRGRTQRDTLQRPCGRNTQRGLRRTIADKRNAVQIMLTDPECSKLSDREIARRCNVSNTFVGNLRKLVPPPAPPGRTVSAHGTASVMAPS